MKYQDQIKSPKWQKKRLGILNRDEFTCQKCGNKDSQLHVHHKHYNNGAKIWEYENWELTTLCEKCHLETNESQKEINNTDFLEIVDRLKIYDKEDLLKINTFTEILLDYDDGLIMLELFLNVFESGISGEIAPYLRLAIDNKNMFRRLTILEAILINKNIIQENI